MCVVEHAQLLAIQGAEPGDIGDCHTCIGIYWLAYVYVGHAYVLIVIVGPFLLLCEACSSFVRLCYCVCD